MSTRSDDGLVPVGVQRAAAWIWRLLLFLLAAVVLVWLLKRFNLIVVPLAVALILSALFLPAVDALNRHKVPRGLAVTLVLLGGLGALGGLLAFVGTRMIDGLPELFEQITVSIDSLRRWLTDGPLELSERQIDSFVNSAITALQDQQARLTSGVLSTASATTQFVGGVFIAIFALVSFLHGGRHIYRSITTVLPASVRDRVRDGGVAGFTALTSFIRATFVVAFVDAVGIGVGLVILGIPLALPLASLVFLGAFIPFVGAVVTGFLAVVVAFLAKGWVFALLTLALVLAVQQLEGNVLQPLIMGKAVRLHPLAVLVALTAGAVVAGVAGVLLAVPALAFTDRAVRALAAAQSAQTPAGAAAEP
ncbi:AI-2E family transporter [Mycobacterium sp. IDR2000157661]|uniref:AI-2E family transporter n=1 Tax=Mycobacterium sp. IDR2000157661 TaxID=2867005 RepID=UPI001EEB7A22|nr:AI-2E family transporter [Mycobacterium sp. IDR2000157661]ULE34507.1 AI-2E family transporter [Mycobacterium sp. IDR2000157661]